MVQSINRKNKGGNAILKVDMAKAYDCVDKKFLTQVMKGFGFSHKVYNLISECVKTPWYLIMMNNTYKGFFKSQQGLRQKVALSLLIFLS